MISDHVGRLFVIVLAALVHGINARFGGLEFLLVELQH